MTTAHHEVSAQCPACGLHELVVVHLVLTDEGIWKQVEAHESKHEAPTESPFDAQGVQIDVCPVCYGAWFDRGELNALSNLASELERSLCASPRPATRPCPHGHGAMLEHDLPGIIRTPVERCDHCGGIWLDGNERRKLAEATMREGQRHPTKRILRRGAIWAAQILTNLPVEVENPARGTPWVTFFVIATLLAAFIAQQLGYIDLYAYAMVPGRLRHHGDIETLLSYMFLHASWVHLLGNAYFLYTFGDNVEHLFGRLRFIVFYGFAGMAAALIHYALTYKTATPVVGASGAISGIMAAYLWAYPHQRLFQVVLWIQLKIPAWMYLIVWFGFQILMGFFATGKQVEGVAWFAHLGGFLVGLAMTPWFLSLRRRQIAARVRVPARLPPSVDAPI